MSHPNECGKSPYPSKTRAETVAHKRMRDNRTLELRVYLCKACGMYHLTHTEDKWKRNREDAA